MEKPIFNIVDVFTEEKYTGNQLAVFRGAKALSDIEMQRIAKEMNYSETTFILSDEKHDDGYDVRIFTPETELPFAGHPTLGTAYVIQQEIVKEPVNKIVLNLKIGPIPVTFNYVEEHPNVLWMKQLGPIFGQTFNVESISQVLDLDAREVDGRYPVQDVSTGVPCIIVPLKTLHALKQVIISRERYLEFIRDIQAKTILIFCPETYSEENQLNVRFFADFYGVPEDPATGSANGCLAGYLVKHRYFGKSEINIRVEQGYEIGRPSLLFLRADEKEEGIDVHVGGRVVKVARGELV
ncbi:MAG: PhzF family phenazine biosynthesis protein [Candidatus Bathyarchaeota archaeon]|nr:PhzF family phenazine biosynthesis protein [Candidatus Bathyarchaeota archaeon]